MQEVYKDGSGGEIESLNQMKDLVEKLDNENVDHVEVFTLGSEAHKRAVGRIKNLNASRRAKRQLKKILGQSPGQIKEK